MELQVNNNNAVIYARYSSEAQTMQSIEGQIRAISEYAKNNNIPIIDSYIDTAISGLREDRPAFQKMIRESKNKTFGYVLVYKYDRFSRDRLNSLLYKRELKKNGVKVISVTEFISDDPQGILFESIIDGYSEYYSAELSQKVKRGNRESRMKGLYSGGQVIYGYKIVEKKYTIIPEEAEVVRKIFNDAARGITYNDIAKELNSRCIKHHGKEFTSSYIHKLIHNKKYIGIIETDGEVFTNIVPPMVEKDTFEKSHIQSTKKKKRGSHYRTKDEYLLSGLIYCGYCGEKMTSDSGTGRSGKISHYYKCSTRKRLHQKCDCKAFKKDYLEDIVVKKIKTIILESNILGQIADYICIAYNKNISENNLLKLNEKEIERNKKELTNAINAVLSGFNSTALKQKITELENEKETLEQENIKLKIRSNSKITPKQALNFLEAIMNLDNTSPKYKKNLIDKFVKRVIVYNDKIIVELITIDGGFNDNNENKTPIGVGSTALADCPPLANVVEHTTLYAGYGCLILQIDLD